MEPITYTFGLDMLDRARIAVETEDNPEVLRLWCQLFKQCEGPYPPTPLGRELNLTLLAALLGAEYHA